MRPIQNGTVIAVHGPIRFPSSLILRSPRECVEEVTFGPANRNCATTCRREVKGTRTALVILGGVEAGVDL